MESSRIKIWEIFNFFLFSFDEASTGFKPEQSQDSMEAALEKILANCKSLSVRTSKSKFNNKDLKFYIIFKISPTQKKFLYQKTLIRTFYTNFLTTQ